MAKYRLISAVETYIPHSGLHVDATYEMVVDEFTCHPKKMTFWNRHAPVELEVDLVNVTFEVPHVWVDKDGQIMKTSEGRPMITRNEYLFCPKTKDGLYLRGFSPQEQKARLLKQLLPCEWARPKS